MVENSMTLLLVLQTHVTLLAQIKNKLQNQKSYLLPVSSLQFPDKLK